MAKEKSGLSLWELVLISIATSVGAGIFVLSGIAMTRAGPSSVFSLIMTALLALLSGICFAELANFVAKEGGVFEYVRETFSPNAGFIGGMLWAAALLSCAAAAAINLSYYIATIFAPASIGASLAILAIAVLIICLAIVVVLTGFKLSLRFLAIYVGLNIAALIVFVFFGFSYISFNVGLTLAAKNLHDTFFAAAAMFFAFTGFAKVTGLARRIKGGGLTIRRMVYISTVIFFLVYLPLALMATGLFSGTSLSAKTSGVAGLPLVEATVLHSKYITLLFLLISAVSLVVMMLMCVMGAATVLYAMGRDNELPGMFSRLDMRGLPRNCILLAAAISIVMIAVAQFSTIVDTVSSTMLLALTIVNLAALNTAIKEKHSPFISETLMGNKYFPLVPIAGILGNLAALSTLGETSLELALGVLLVSGLYYTYGKVLVLPKGKALEIKESPVHMDVSEFED